MESVNVTEMVSQRRMQAKADLQSQGMRLPARPGYDLPRLPLKLSELGDDQVMQLLVQFTRYQDYISGQLVADEIDELAADHMLEVAKARHLVKGWGGKAMDTVTVAKASALLDPDVQQLIDHHATLKAHRKLLAVLSESMARDAAVVSREITRRTSRDHTERRADRFS